MTGVAVDDAALDPGELPSNDDDDDGVNTDVEDPTVPDEEVPSEVADPTVLVDPPEVESIRASAMDETDGAPTTGRDDNGIVAILDEKLVVLGLLRVLPDVVLPNEDGAQGDGLSEIGFGVTVDVDVGLVVESGGCAVGVVTACAGAVWICAANAAEANARPTQLNRPVFITHSCYRLVSSLFMVIGANIPPA